MSAFLGVKYIKDAYYDSNAKYKQAWEMLYQHQNGNGKKMLDSNLLL